MLQFRARLSALWTLNLILSATTERAAGTRHAANMPWLQKVRGVASNRSITTRIASCGKRKQKQVSISLRKCECEGLIWRGTYLRMPGTSTSSASTKSGSRIFMLRNEQNGGRVQAGFGSSFIEASGSAHWFQACLVLNPSLFLTSVASFLSS